MNLSRGWEEEKTRGRIITRVEESEKPRVGYVINKARKKLKILAKGG